MSVMFDFSSRERREERCYFCGVVLPNRCYGIDVDGRLQLICADCFRAASALEYLLPLGTDMDTLQGLYHLWQLRTAAAMGGE